MTSTLIASSAHLAGGSAPDLSEVEFGLMIASHAFDRWTVRCMAAAGLPDLTPTDVMVFHHVFHRQRPKKLADICFTLNVEDTHIVNYALKSSTAWAWSRASAPARKCSTASRPRARPSSSATAKSASNA